MDRLVSDDARTQPTPESRTDAERIQEAIARHPGAWWSVTVLSVLAALAVNQWMPPVYEATTSVVFETSPGDIPALKMALPTLENSVVQNQIEEIRSRSLAEEVVRALPPQFRRAIGDSSSADDAARVDWVCRNVRPRAVKDSDVIRIRVQAQDPALAATVANTLTDVLQKRNLGVRRQEADALYRFLDEQVAQTSTRLKESEDSLNAYKRANQVVPLDKESEALLQRMTDLEVRLSQVGSERKAQEARLSAVRGEIASQEGNLKDLADPTQPWLGQLRQRLVDLELRSATLGAQNYPSDHPQVRKLEKEIEETRSKLSAEVERIVKRRGVADPMARRNDLIVQKLDLEMDLDALRAKEKALTQAIQQNDRETNALPAKELELLRLARGQQLHEKLYLMLNEKREEARIAQAGEIGNLRVIDPATIAQKPVRPRPVLNLAVALVIGMTTATGTCLGLRPSSRRIHSLADAERALQLKVVAEIPRIPSAWSGRLGRSNKKKPLSTHDTLLAPRAQSLLASEAFRSLAARFTHLEKDPVRSVLVTSAVPGEGKTTTAFYLALFAAELGASTLLVDCDLRRPSLHRLLGIERAPGLTDLLEGRASEATVIGGNILPNFRVVPAGAPARDPVRLLSSSRFADWMAQARHNYDLIVVDASPVLAVCDALVIAQHIQGTLLVTRSSSSMVEDSARAVRLFRDGGRDLLGVVVNDLDWKRVYGRGFYYGKIQRYYTRTGSRSRMETVVS